MLSVREVNGQRGLFSSSKNFQLFIPKQEFISKENIQKSQVESLQSHISQLDSLAASDYYYIMLYFQYLYCLNQTQELEPSIVPHKTYFELMPKMDCVLAWDLDSIEFALLQDTSLDRSIRSKLKVLERDYSNFNFFAISFDEYVQLDCLIRSRTMEYDGNVVIVPLVDFCNHSNEYNAVWKIGEHGLYLIPIDREEELDNPVVSKDSPWDLVSLAGGDVLVDSLEILISYGKKSNLELFFNYQFVIKDNLYDTVSFFPPLFEYDFLTSEFLTEDDKERFYSLPAMLLVHSDNQEYLDVLDMNSYQKLVGCLLRDDDKLPLKELESKALVILLDICKERLFRLDLELDDSIKGLNERVRMVEILRTGMINCLKDVIQRLTDQLDSITKESR